MPNPVLVLGLGNTLFSDDGAAILAVREARAHWEGAGVDFEEAAAGGLELLDRLTGYRAALVVDAAVTGQAKPGEHYLLNLESLGARLVGGAHGAHLGTALSLAAHLGVPMPAHIEVLAIEARDVATPCEQPTRAVAAAIPRVAATILSPAAGACTACGLRFPAGEAGLVCTACGGPARLAAGTELAVDSYEGE